MNRDELQHDILNVLNNQEGKYPDFSHTVRSIMDLVDQYHGQDPEKSTDRPVMLSELFEIVWGVYIAIDTGTTVEEAFDWFAEALHEQRG